MSAAERWEMEEFLVLCGLSEKVIVGGIWRLCALDKKWFSQHALNTANPTAAASRRMTCLIHAHYSHIACLSLLLAQPLIIVGKLRTRNSEFVGNSNPVFEVLLR